MANVSFQQLGSGFLKAGASESKYWLNAPSPRVWAFSVEPKDVSGTEILLGPGVFEITRVVYHLTSPGERKVEVVVKNRGNVDSGYNLYMARIGA